MSRQRYEDYLGHIQELAALPAKREQAWLRAGRAGVEEARKADHQVSEVLKRWDSIERSSREIDSMLLPLVHKYQVSTEDPQDCLADSSVRIDSDLRQLRARAESILTTDRNLTSMQHSVQATMRINAPTPPPPKETSSALPAAEKSVSTSGKSSATTRITVAILVVVTVFVVLSFIIFS